MSGNMRNNNQDAMLNTLFTLDASDPFEGDRQIREADSRKSQKSLKKSQQREVVRLFETFKRLF